MASIVKFVFICAVEMRVLLLIAGPMEKWKAHLRQANNYLAMRAARSVTVCVLKRYISFFLFGSVWVHSAVRYKECKRVRVFLLHLMCAVCATNLKITPCLMWFYAVWFCFLFDKERPKILYSTVFVRCVSAQLCRSTVCRSGSIYEEICGSILVSSQCSPLTVVRWPSAS